MLILFGVQFMLAAKQLKLKTSDSKILSVVVLYLVTPCVIIDSFQVEFDTALLKGIALSVSAALLIHLLLIFGTKVLENPLKLQSVERASIIYPNAASIIIPIVTAILGKEWVLFSAPFLLVQHSFLWSHCCALISGETTFNPKKILLNVNIIAIAIGLVLFTTGLRFPTMIGDAISSVGACVGPVSMIVTGMLLGGFSWAKIGNYRRLPVILLLRLIAFPMMTLLIYKFTPLRTLAPDGEAILLISYLAAVAPTASSVTQLSQVYGGDSEYAGLINMTTTLSCILTMPLMVFLLQL